MLNKGQTIDRYTVDSVIGHGGTAVVYLVKHNQLGSTHALKVLSLTSGAIRERLLREGRVQAALQHNNIVTVTDVLNVDGSPGLLMEHVDGPSLDMAMKRYKIALNDAQTLFRGIVSGVRAAHRHGLVHRDLKPANVLLFPSPEGFVPKVTDFGLAKVVVGRTSEVGQTRQGIAMGTPAYMAPEQIRDARSVDQRADMFSLGCILYELVTRQRTFPGEQALEIYNNIVAGRYTPPDEVVPDLPDAIIAAIDGCLALEREDRIPDCDVLLQVLAGTRNWEVGDHPVPDDVQQTEEVPRDAPVIPVALRKVTPPPAEPRASQPSISETDVSVTDSQPLGGDGTLGGDRSLVPEDEEPSLNTGVPETSRRRRPGAWFFVAGAAVVLLLFVMVVGLAAVWGLGLDRMASDAVGFTTPEQGLQLPAAPGASADPGLSLGEPGIPAEVMPPTAPAGPVILEPEDPVVDDLIIKPAVVPTSSSNLRKPTPPAEPVRHTVRFYSKPLSVHLWVDGQKFKRTPRKLELAPGRHTIRMKDLQDEVTFEVDVRASGDNTWCYAFGGGGLADGRCE